MYIATFIIYTDPPVILTHPSNHTVAAGITVSLYCNVSGFAIMYVWEMRSVNEDQWSRIQNSNSHKYDVRNIQQSKEYRCIGSDRVGSVASNPATIQVLSKLYITIIDLKEPTQSTNTGWFKL